MKSECKLISSFITSKDDKLTYHVAFSGLDVWNSGYNVGYSGTCDEETYDKIKKCKEGQLFKGIYTYNRGFCTLEDLTLL